MSKKLIIAEKPSVGKAIAEVLGVTENKSGYMENDRYIVSWAFGHLISLGMPHEQNPAWKEWSLSLLPMFPDEYIYLINKDSKEQFELLKELIHRPDVSEIVNAGDDGREGEYIQRLIYWKAGNTKPMKRLLIDSVSEKTILKGMNNLEDGHIYDGKFEAGKGRDRADWLIGMNLSRFLSCTYSTKGLVIGRVKTPTTAMVVHRDMEIKNFVPVPYWVLQASFSSQEGVTYTGQWFSNAGDDEASEENNESSSRLSKKELAEEIKNKIENKSGSIISIKKKKKTTNRPKLYSLSDLQIDSINAFGYTSDQVLEIAQALYEKHKITTYPRTDSNYITEDLGNEFTMLIHNIKEKSSVYAEIAEDLLNTGLNLDKNVINDAKVTDHHAIIINENYLAYDLSKLTPEEQNVLHLIISRMLLAVGQPYEYYETTVITCVEGEQFKSSGKTVIDKGFVRYQEKLFTTRKKEAVTELTGLQENQSVQTDEVSLKEKKTTPPKPYTEATLLQAMKNVSRVIEDQHLKDMIKDKGIGTEATRSGILAELFNKRYLERGKGKLPPIHATKKGHDLIAIAPPELTSPILSAEWEDKLYQVEIGQYNLQSFIEEIENYIRTVISTYQKNNDIQFEQSGDGNGKKVLGKCPHCGADYISGKFGAFCSKKCGFSCSMAFGKKLSEQQVKSLLEGKKTLVKGLSKKSGTGTYDAYLCPKGILEKKTDTGIYYNYEFDMEFPTRKKSWKK